MLIVLQNECGYYNKPLLCFMNGMFPENKRPRLYAKMKSIRIINGYFTDLKINKPVYDIEFQLINENKKQRIKILKVLLPVFNVFAEVEVL